VLLSFGKESNKERVAKKVKINTDTFVPLALHEVMTQEGIS
jgi:hypothetical protein